MPNRKSTPSAIAAQMRGVLKEGGSSRHSAEVQWFFKDEIKSRGWYTAEIRQVAVHSCRTIQSEMGLPFLVQVADKLFAGRMLEEKIFAVFLLEKSTGHFTDAEFMLFEAWLERITSWADHDALVHSLISPMIVADPSRADFVFRWAKSPNRWLRRAACVALIRGARQKKFFPEIKRLTALLLGDQDDMVQKGLGWLLRETAKYNPRRTVPYLMTIRKKAPRLVLRTACETLPEATRRKILA
jgi:3-methyladenine DNA glycosylase AlkD